MTLANFHRYRSGDTEHDHDLAGAALAALADARAAGIETVAAALTEWRAPAPPNPKKETR